MFDLTHGLRVLDLGTGVSGPYYAKLLLDAGADVVAPDLDARTARLSRTSARRAQARDRDAADGLQRRGVRGTRGRRDLWDGPGRGGRHPAKAGPARTHFLSPWAYPVKAREVDADYKERLRARFGRFA